MREELEALASELVERVFSKIVALSGEPRPRGVKKRTGSDRLYRLRIGDHRVIYAIDDRLRRIEITAVRHRRDAYR